MDVSEMITELNEHGFEDTSSVRKVALINDTIWDICSREAWPFLEGSIELTFNGSSTVPSNFPTDFSKALSVTDAASGNVIRWERWEVVQKTYPSSIDTAGLGYPQAYYFRDNQLRVFPLPASNMTLDLNYVKWPAELSAGSLEADIVIPTRHQRAIILGTLYKLYAMEDDPELSALFKDEYETRVSMMRDDLIREQYDLADRIFVLDDDDYYP
jgi:hypothetical protein